MNPDDQVPRPTYFRSADVLLMNYACTKMVDASILSSDKNLSNALHPPKEKPLKPKGKEEKAPPVEKLTIDDLFLQF